MKKSIFSIAAVVVLLGSMLLAGDVKKEIVGSWTFDLGGGYMASADYKANGTFDQKMGEMTISGTYTVQGNKITTVASGRTTVFTVEKSDASSMTLKRDSDGKIMVYKKK